MARKTGTNKSSGADLRAMRETRAAELVDPASEARRREKSFLSNLANALGDYQWLVRNEGWRSLGFDSLGAWYTSRVEQPMRALGARPNPEVGIDMALRIYEEETELPPAQRRSMADLATIAGVSERKFRRLVSRSAPAANDRVTDLGNPTVIDDVEFTEDSSSGGGSDTGRGQDSLANGPSEGHDGSAREGVGGRLPVGATQNPPAAESSDSTGSARTGRTEAEAQQQPGPNAPSDDAETSTPPEEPGDRYESDEGDKSGEAADPPAASPDLVHTDHPHRVAGEAPTGSEVLSSASAQPSDEGEASGDETAEGPLQPSQEGSSAVDLDDDPFIEWADRLVDVIGRRPAAVEALGAPVLNLQALWAQVDELAAWCDEVDRLRKGAAS